MGSIRHQVADGAKGYPIISHVFNKHLSVWNSAGILLNRMRATIVAVVIVVGCLVASTSHAGELLMQGPSVHFGSTDHNDANLGLGYIDEYYAVGAYYNSYSKITAYAALHWEPIHIDRLEFGAVLGLGTGYNNTPLSPVGSLTGRVAITDNWGAWVLLVPSAHGVVNFGLGYRW